MSGAPAATDSTTTRRVGRRWEPDLDTPDDPGLVAKVVRLDLLVTKSLDDIAARAGISLADYLVLGVVRRSPDGRSTPSRICEVLRRTSGGMTLTIDRLEAAGWLTRSADPTDRRRVLVELTDAGREIAIGVNRDMHAWEERLALPVRTRERIDHSLDALLAVFDA